MANIPVILLGIFTLLGGLLSLSFAVVGYFPSRYNVEKTPGDIAGAQFITSIAAMSGSSAIALAGVAIIILGSSPSMIGGRR